MNIKQNNFFKKSLLSLAVVGALSTSFIAAANTGSAGGDIETISVTASRSPMDIADSLASQVIITRADIARIQPKSVLDVLSTVAGIDISATGGRGQTSSVYMRGANASHTLVLIDGVRISSASLGSTSIQSVAPELIERIEIVKGPRAALWGSDAIGGVIQIFTRKLRSDKHFANATIGSENYQKLSAGTGISHGEGSTSIIVNHEKSAGFDVKDDAESDDDGFDYTSVAINGQQQINDALSLNWLAQVDDGNNEFDSSFGGNENDVKNHIWQLSANYDWKVSDITNHSAISISQNRTSSVGYGNGISKEGGSLFDTRRDQISLVNNSSVNEHWQFNLGTDFYTEELKGNTQYTDKERNVFGVFGHVIYQRGAFSYELSTRYDDVDGIDSETTYNTSIGYQVAAHTRVVLAAGSGFKTPSFNDLYWPADAWSAGNSDLVSETSDTLEFSVISQFDELGLSFNIFSTDIENLIAWKPDENFTYKPENVADADIKGAEFGAKYIGLGGSHQFNISYIEAEDKATGDQLARRAKEHASYQFDTSIGKADVYAEWQYKGERYEYLFDGSSVELDSYQVVNLGLSYPLANAWKLQTKVNNAFNEQYTTSQGYHAQERVAYIGVTFQN